MSILKISRMKPRRHARNIALQVLYELDQSDHPPGEVLTQRLAEEGAEGEVAEYARRLITGVLRYRDIIDAFIQKNAPEWPLAEMAIIDRNILRVAVVEFALERTAPTKVAINEAVELAKSYGSDSAPRFINGVLGAVVGQEAELRRAAARLDMPG